MENTENVTAAPADQEQQQTQTTAQPDATPTADAAPTATATPAPATDAAVVTPEVVAERLAAKNAEKPAPLSAIRDANRRKQEGEGAKDAKERRPRRERPQREERKLTEPRRPKTGAVLPSRREGLGDLEEEFNSLMDGASLEQMMTGNDAAVASEQLEEGTKVDCKVEKISKDSVFVNIGMCELGLIPLKQFPDDLVLTVGQQFQGVVNKFNTEDGYYEVSLPGAAAEVGDWLSVSKGTIVEATVTGTNKGGLEVMVGKLRGFMPSGQIAPFFVANPETLVGERWKCVVTEVNPERRNLIVSRRALMEQERAEQREKTLAELAVGQTREGTVRKVIEIGAFVDLGGVDGFIHVSQMAWGRVKQASDVVKEGDKVSVTILKIDEAKKRISLSLRDSAKDPWNTVDSEYKEGDVVRGVVSRILDFGAFVELPIGVEGLVHISEIAYQRVDKVEDALKEGDAVDVKILSIDRDKRKIGLSIKKTQEDPRIKAREEAKAKAEADAAAAEAEEKRRDDAALEASRERIRKLQSKKPLKGGVGGVNDNKFGLHF